MLLIAAPSSASCTNHHQQPHHHHHPHQRYDEEEEEEKEPVVPAHSFLMRAQGSCTPILVVRHQHCRYSPWSHNLFLLHSSSIVYNCPNHIYCSTSYSVLSSSPPPLQNHQNNNNNNNNLFDYYHYHYHYHYFSTSKLANPHCSNAYIKPLLLSLDLYSLSLSATFGGRYRRFYRPALPPVPCCWFPGSLSLSLSLSLLPPSPFSSPNVTTLLCAAT